jgi:hypothetical protein
VNIVMCNSDNIIYLYRETFESKLAVGSLAARGCFFNSIKVLGEK